jgi:hypothetical protein
MKSRHTISAGRRLTLLRAALTAASLLLSVLIVRLVSLKKLEIRGQLARFSCYITLQFDNVSWVTRFDLVMLFCGGVYPISWDPDQIS